MRTSHFVIAVTLATAPLISQAEIVSYTFSGHVNSMVIFDDMSGMTYMDAQSVIGAQPISAGDLMTGQITYDTSVCSISENGLLCPGAIRSLSLKFDSAGVQLQSSFESGNIYAYAGPNVVTGYHDLDLSASNGPEYHNSWGSLSVAGNFSNLSNLALTPMVSHAAAHNGSSWMQDGRYYHQYVTSDLDTLNQVSAVPEPDTWSMFAIGAVVLLGLARRQRRA